MNQQKRYFESSIDHQHHSHHHTLQQHNYQHLNHQLVQNPTQHTHYQPSVSNAHLYSSSLPNYSTLTIKSEPPNVNNNNNNNNQPLVYHVMESTRDNPMLTPSVPIPRTGKMMADFSEFNFDLEQSQSPQTTQDYIAYGLTNSNSNSNQMWSIINESVMTKHEPFHMDDDDIFQVDKADLFQSPTLAELNDDTALEDLNIDDLILPAESTGLTLLNNATIINMQTNAFNDASNPPQQLLQHSLNLNSNQSQQMQMDQQSLQHNQAQLLSQGITLGRDALLYDEQTNSSSPYDIYQANATPKSVNSSAAFSPDSHGSSSSPLLHNSISPPPYILNNNTITINNNNSNNNNNNNNNNSISPNKMQYTALQELLKQEPGDTKLGQSVPGPSSTTVLRNRHENYHQRRLQFAHQHSGGNSLLSSSAPANTSIWHAQQMWQRREPRQHLLSTGSLAEATGSTSSLSTGGIVSPEANDFSHDEGYEDSDSDHYEDYSTDDGKQLRKAYKS